MKKRIILIYLLSCIAFVGFSRIDCDIEGHGNVATISVNFEDEDCKTKEFEYTYTYLDGTVEEGVSTENDAPWGEMDFGDFDCCEPT